MKERGVLFSAPMVRALLAVAKTQTRRLVKLREFGPSTTRGYDWTFRDKRALWNDVGTKWLIERCPYGVPGDRLWVRETHAKFAVGDRGGIVPQCVAYRATCDADGSFDYVNNGDEIMHLKVTKWTPAIFMPRWVSRITLEVTEVRVQRLQDISEEDARAEGPLFAIDQEQTVLFPGLTAERNTGCSACQGDGRGIAELCHDSTRGKRRPFACWYATVWDAINGTGSWERNPWVFAISFKRMEDKR